MNVAYFLFWLSLFPSFYAIFFLLFPVHGVELSQRNALSGKLLVIEHNLDTHNKFKQWIKINLDDEDEISAWSFPSQPISKQDFDAIKGLVREKEFYKLRASIIDMKAKERSYVFTSVNTCLLIAFSFEALITIHVNKEKTHVIGMDYSVKDNSNGTLCYSFEASLWSEFDKLEQKLVHSMLEWGTTEIRLSSGIEGSKPMIAEVRAIEEAEAEKEKQQQQQPGFFQKYWYIFLPVGIMVLLNNVASGIQQQQSQENGSQDHSQSSSVARRRAD